MDKLKIYIEQFEFSIYCFYNWLDKLKISGVPKIDKVCLCHDFQKNPHMIPENNPLKPNIPTSITNYSTKETESPVNFLNILEQIVFNLTKSNLESSVLQTMELFDSSFPYSFNFVLSNLIFIAFNSHKNKNSDIYINYLKLLQSKEEEINKNDSNIICVFTDFLLYDLIEEKYYLIERMIEENFIDSSVAHEIPSIYFAQYKTEKEYTNLLRFQFKLGINDFESYEELSKNDFELHKKLIKEGHNPNEITKIIRNDEIEKLQEISSQKDFDYNQTIKPSLYERYSIINHKNVSLIDYAAFFGSVKCFKYLLMNGAKVENTGKYAIAGGNEEIIHLCEQNHSSFEYAYETAIEFHRNDIFKYLYENKLEQFDNNKLGKLCIEYGNYEIFAFLLEKGLKINESLIGKSAKIGNLYLVKYFIQNYYLPKNILIKSSRTRNIEFVKFILGQKGIDINAKNLYLFYVNIF